MKKNKIIILGVVIIVIGTVLLACKILNEEEKVVISNDITEFIEEYESYNGEELYEKEILSLDLNEDAIIYITSAEDIVDVMLEEDALIYFGFATCPWCRNMISTLLDVAVDKNQAIYYVDIKEVRNLYTVEDGLLIESTIGEDAYYEILEIFGEFLSDYIVYDEEGNEYNTNTTRLYGPTLITVRDGELLDMYVGTHSEITDPYTALTEEEYEELYTEYGNMINDLQNTSCSLDNNC